MINIGILGLGGAGRAHIRRFRRNPAVGEIFGYDPKHIGKTINGVVGLRALDDLLNRVDAVSICTPDDQHYTDIFACVQAKKHVLVEKPMVASYQEAVRLHNLLERNADLVFGVHHQMRHAPAFRRAHDLIREGALGNIFYVEANYWHDMKPRNALYDDWRLRDGQSLIFGHACHTFDLILSLLNSEPKQHHTLLAGPVGKHGYTSATTTMAFESGAVGKSHVNSNCAYPQLNDLVILGDEGSYVDGVLYRSGTFSQVSDFFGKGDRQVNLNVVSIMIPQFLIGIVFKTYLWVFNRLAKSLMSNPDFGFRRFPLTAYNHDGACQAIVDNFISAIQGKCEVFVGYEDALRVLRLCEAAERDGLRNR